MVAITYNYIIVARLFLCGTRHACLRHRRSNEFILSHPPRSPLPDPFFPSLGWEEPRKQRGNLPRNFAIFPLHCGARRVLRAYEIEGKENIYLFIYFFGKKSSLTIVFHVFFFFFFNLFDCFTNRWCAKISIKERCFIKLRIIKVEDEEETKADNRVDSISSRLLVNYNK